MIQSELSIISSKTLRPDRKSSRYEPSLAGKLMWSASWPESLPEVREEFHKERSNVLSNFNISAARFPSMDLPVDRLIVFEELVFDYTDKDREYEDYVEKIKKFYVNELSKQRGRVVIEFPRLHFACEGLRRAIIELQAERKCPSEIIIASSHKDFSENCEEFLNKPIRNQLNNVTRTHKNSTQSV